MPIWTASGSARTWARTRTPSSRSTKARTYGTAWPGGRLANDGEGEDRSFALERSPFELVCGEACWTKCAGRKREALTRRAMCADEGQGIAADQVAADRSHVGRQCCDWFDFHCCFSRTGEGSRGFKCHQSGRRFNVLTVMLSRYNAPLGPQILERMPGPATR